MNRTKFILSGGFIEKAADGGKKYCEEILDGKGLSVNILECMFALPEDYWKKSLDKDIALFSKWLPNIHINFIVADSKVFISQVLNSDVLIIRGGSVDTVIDTLKEIDGLETSLYNKTVVGVSAGAYAFSSRFLKVSDKGDAYLEDGLKYLPIKIVTHYQSDFYPNKFPKIFNWNNVDLIMDTETSNLEIVKLKEGEFIIQFK